MKWLNIFVWVWLHHLFRWASYCCSSLLCLGQPIYHTSLLFTLNHQLPLSTMLTTMHAAYATISIMNTVFSSSRTSSITIRLLTLSYPCCLLVTFFRKNIFVFTNFVRHTNSLGGRNGESYLRSPNTYEIYTIFNKCR